MRFMDLPVWPLRSWSHKCTQNEIQSLSKTNRQINILFHLFCIVGILHFILCVSENVFDWDIYLRKQKAVAAPKECFLQVSEVFLLFELHDIHATYYWVFMPPLFKEWWRGLKCYPCPCVRACVCASVRFQNLVSAQ